MLTCQLCCSKLCTVSHLDKQPLQLTLYTLWTSSSVVRTCVTQRRRAKAGIEHFDFPHFDACLEFMSAASVIPASSFGGHRVYSVTLDETLLTVRTVRTRAITLRASRRPSSLWQRQLFHTFRASSVCLRHSSALCIDSRVFSSCRSSLRGCQQGLRARQRAERRIRRVQGHILRWHYQATDGAVAPAPVAAPQCRRPVQADAAAPRRC